VKKSILFIFLIASALTKAQSFEGTLIYVCDIELSKNMAKKGQSKDSTLTQLRKNDAWFDTLKTVYKEGNYLKVLGNKHQSKILYRADSNKIYAFESSKGKNIGTVSNADIDFEKTMNGQEAVITTPDTLVWVNGIACNLVRIQMKFVTYEYYYSKAHYPMTARFYANHAVGSWYAYLRRANALPIMMVIKSDYSITKIFTLISAKEEKINDNIFTAPELVE
jgi:hypothetical protein